MGLQGARLAVAEAVVNGEDVLDVFECVTVVSPSVFSSPAKPSGAVGGEVVLGLFGRPVGKRWSFRDPVRR